MHREKRFYQRYAVTCHLSGRPLHPIEGGEATALLADQYIDGEVANISIGGLCLLTDERVNVFDPFRCEILVPPMPVAIPALVQVRWAFRNSDGRKYRVGFQFLV